MLLFDGRTLSWPIHFRFSGLVGSAQMFQDLGMEVTAIARAVARGIEPKDFLKSPALLGFADNTTGLFVEDPALWAKTQVSYGAVEFELLIVVPDIAPHLKIPIPRSGSIGREQCWIRAIGECSVTTWCDISWAGGIGPGWHTIYATAEYGPVGEPCRSMEEATLGLNLALEANRAVATAMGEAEMADCFERASLVLAGSIPLNAEICSVNGNSLSDRAERMLCALSVAPPLWGMGSWPDRTFPDQSEFDMVLEKLADARCRCFEACANTSYNDLPKIGDPEREALRTEVLSHLLRNPRGGAI